MIRSIQQDALLHHAPALAIFMAGAEEQYNLYSEIANVLSVSNEYSLERFDTGLPAVPRVDGDLTPTPNADYAESPPYRVHQLNYRLAYGYTRRADRYDNYGRIAEKASSLSASAIHTMNVIASMPSSLAEAGATWGWADETLGNNAHAMIGTTATFDNLFAAAAPGSALYEDLIEYGSQMPSEEGFKTRAEIESIEVGSTAYEAEWIKYFGSPTEVGQDNPNVINPYLRRSVPKIIFNPYMGNPTRQIVKYRGHRVNLEVGLQPTFETWGKDDPSGIMHRVEFDANIGIGEMRHVVVVAGA